MAVVLHMEPKTEPMSWRQFCKTHGPYSIAIDGYVSGAPVDSDNSPRLNLNHHEDVNRLFTRATCAQALVLVKKGILKLFTDKGEVRIDIYANDCDQDVCLTWFIFKYGYMSKYVVNPRLNRLVAMEDMLDATAGSYPYPTDMPSMQELAWVFEPYSRFRLSGRLALRDEKEFTGVVTDVEQRIMAHIMGNGDAIPLDTAYEVLGGGKGWKIIKEVGAQAYNGLAEDGVTAFVSSRVRPDGKWDHTLYRGLPLGDFDVPVLLSELSKIDIAPWGGGNPMIGGSNRALGSKFGPTELQTVIPGILPNLE